MKSERLVNQHMLEARKVLGNQISAYSVRTYPNPPMMSACYIECNHAIMARISRDYFFVYLVSLAIYIRY